MTQPAGLSLTRILGVTMLALGLSGPALAQQAPPAPPAGAANILDAVRSRGTLVCAVSTGLAGFSQPDSQGTWRGIDADYCRAVAAAILGDPNKVRYVATTTQARFTAVQSGEVDLLARNTTYSFARDTSLGLDFPAINFYDGQGFMVRRSANLSAARELDGATICVQPGTTTEQNLADWARANNIRFTPVVIERLEEVVAAYVNGRCDAYTTDVSGLAAVRSAQAQPNDHAILPDIISKEPLALGIRQGDARFADVVRWVHFALLAAEELGITQANAQQMASDPRPEVQRLLGRTGELGRMIGLDNAWAMNAIRAVGNYGELFERHLTPLGIRREGSPNAMWTRGGLHYTPPFR